MRSSTQVHETSAEAAVVPRFALRLDEIAQTLGVSRRSIERAKSSGRLPKPDIHVGRMPLWKVETIRRWIDGGGK